MAFVVDQDVEDADIILSRELICDPLAFIVRGDAARSRTGDALREQERTPTTDLASFLRKMNEYQLGCSQAVEASRLYQRGPAAKPRVEF